MKIRTKKKTCQVEIIRDGETWVFEVDPLDPEQEEEIRRKHTEYNMVRGHVMPDPDFVAIKIETAQKVIKSWPCTDDDDKPIPCTDENKKTAWLLNSDLINDVLSKAADIGTGRAKIKTEEKKI